jgi:hypothetical protein
MGAQGEHKPQTNPNRLKGQHKHAGQEVRQKTLQLDRTSPHHPHHPHTAASYHSPPHPTMLTLSHFGFRNSIKLRGGILSV